MMGEVIKEIRDRFVKSIIKITSKKKKVKFASNYVKPANAIRLSRVTTRSHGPRSNLNSSKRSNFKPLASRDKC